MNVLVTGANGFVGSTLVTRLAFDGTHRVRAAVRRKDYVPPPHVECITGDLSLDRDWAPNLEGIDSIVHLAARVHVSDNRSAEPIAEYRRVNVAGTAHLVRAAAMSGVRRFVYLSSIKVNGESGRFSEEDPARPADPYAQSKYEAEVAVRQFAAERGLEFVIIRPPLVYGPGVRANFQMLMRAIASGVPLPFGAIQNRRSLVGVDNLVDFIVTCLTHPAAANETFLVADGEDLSTPDLVRRLAQAMGRRARLFSVPESLLRLGAVLCGRADSADRLLGSLQADITKARTRMSWSPPLTVDEGLVRTATTP